MPDHTRPGKASDLIKRFQQAVDDHSEAPLVVSSSFASPARPRTSNSTSISPTATRRPAPAPAPVSPRADPAIETFIPFRSAGLDAQPRRDDTTNDLGKNATGAFDHVIPAPSQAQCNALAHGTAPEPASQDQIRQHSRSPSIAIQQPSIDVPAPVEPVPGSTDSIAPRRSPSPVPVSEPTAHDEDKAPAQSTTSTQRPRSPSPSPSPLDRGKEGLSRPTSPAADPSLLRSPPIKDDDSPPGSPARPSFDGNDDDVPSASKPLSSESADDQDAAPRVDSESSEPCRSTMTSLDSNPVATSLSRVSRVPIASSSSSSTSSSTQTPKKKPISPSTTSTPHRTSTSPTTSLKKPTRPTSTSPTSSRLTSPTASSLAKTRPRVTSSSSSSGPTNISPTRTRSANSRVPSPTSTRMSPTNSRSSQRPGAEGAGGGGETGRSSTSSALKGTRFDSDRARAPGDTTGENGRSAGDEVPRKMASKGRIGLAGAGGQVQRDEDGSGPDGTTRQRTRREGAEGEEGDREEKEDGQRTDLESIPVFKGFGADRPHGRIPIPMEKVVDPETGEEKIMAKQPRAE